MSQCGNCGKELTFDHHLYCTECLVSFVAEKHQIEPEPPIKATEALKPTSWLPRIVKWHRTTAPWRRK